MAHPDDHHIIPINFEAEWIYPSLKFSWEHWTLCPQIKAKGEMLNKYAKGRQSFEIQVRLPIVLSVTYFLPVEGKHCPFQMVYSFLLFIWLMIEMAQVYLDSAVYGHKFWLIFGPDVR